MNLKFTKTLKFKLTLWNTLVLFFFCLLLVFSLNLWLSRYMDNPIERFDRPRFRFMMQEQRDLVLESRMADVENIRKISIYAIFPLLMISFGGGYFLAMLMLKPLEKLNTEIEKKNLNNLDKEIDFEDNGDEISELIKSFNSMSRNLSKSFESQKQFVENASHELKTPLAIIQANLDTALEDKSIAKRGVGVLLKNSKKQIKLMDDLTEDLLLLSYIDSKSTIPMEKIDLAKLINSLADTELQGMKFFFENMADSSTILGNSLLLERCFKNLIENSLKYSEGKEIRLVLETKPNEIHVTFSDDGKGIPKEHRLKIFQRFYRVDKGRSRQKGGTGLGLAITKEILDRHNATISLDNKYVKGTRFNIVFRI